MRWTGVAQYQRQRLITGKCIDNSMVQQPDGMEAAGPVYLRTPGGRDPMISKWLSIKEAAIYANISKNEIKRHMKEGRLLSMTFEGRKKIFIEPVPRKGQVLPNTAAILQPIHEVSRHENEPIRAASPRTLLHNALDRARRSAGRYQWANCALCVIAVGCLGLASFAVLNAQSRIGTHEARNYVLTQELTNVASERDFTSDELAKTSSKLAVAAQSEAKVQDLIATADSSYQEAISSKARLINLVANLDQMQQRHDDDLKQAKDLEAELTVAQARIQVLEKPRTAIADDPKNQPLVQAVANTP
jgi:hypothetical protein